MDWKDPHRPFQTPPVRTDNSHAWEGHEAVMQLESPKIPGNSLTKTGKRANRPTDDLAQDETRSSFFALVRISRSHKQKPHRSFRIPAGFFLTREPSGSETPRAVPKRNYIWNFGAMRFWKENT